MVEKRGNPDAGGEEAAAAKRARGDEPSGSGAAAAAAAPPAAAAVKKPTMSLEALEKAKKALQLQKQLKEKLKNLPQLQRPAGAGAAAPRPPAATDAAGHPLLAAATAKAAQIAASFGLPVTAPQPPASAAAAAAAASAAAAAAAAMRPPAGGPGAGFRAAPLRLDSQGREVDDKGNVISRTVQVVTTLKVNQQHIAPEKRGALAPPPSGSAPSGSASSLPHVSGLYSSLVVPPLTAEAEMQADPGFDPRMSGQGLKRMDRRRRAGFDFVQEGKFQKEAEIMRLKARFGDAAMKRSAPLPKGPIGAQPNPNMMPLGAGAAGGDPNMVPIGVRRAVTPEAEAAAAVEEDKREPAPPDVEWWDRNLLATGSYEADVQEGGVAVKESKLTRYVEHPVPLEPPAEPEAPAPQPLKLTKKELKKLRTQRRQAREKEKQDLIRQGLLEPPKPKVKIANLYRVLGEQAVADPTAMEREARKQMAERQAAHDDRNLSRKLLPNEKRDKKLKRLFDDTGLDVITTVYKLAHLDNKQQRFKIDINAKENHMTGLILVSQDFSLVIVEGCPKSSKRYLKLMLRRIDWAQEPEEEEDEEQEQEAMDEDGNKKGPNVCDMVWQGIVKARAFKKFSSETIPDPVQAKALLEANNIGHYWDIAAAFNRDEAPRILLD